MLLNILRSFLRGDQDSPVRLELLKNGFGAEILPVILNEEHDAKPALSKSRSMLKYSAIL